MPVQNRTRGVNYWIIGVVAISQNRVKDVIEPAPDTPVPERSTSCGIMKSPMADSLWSGLFAQCQTDLSAGMCHAGQRVHNQQNIFP